MLNNRRQEAAHLLRRVGFGPKSLDEINQIASFSHQEAVASLMEFNPEETVVKFDLANRLLAKKPISTDWDQSDLQQSWLELMLQTDYPLQEKMALFWHGHFTSSIDKVGDGQLMVDQNLYFRHHGLGNFEKMVRDISRDPAMLIYLDSVNNSRENPNENYARELMELFTLGLGNYTEQDIREAARAFTGFRYEDNESPGPNHPQIVFDRELHDYTIKTFMGVSGDLDADAIISIILKRREVSYYIACKLWEYLVYPEPGVDLVKELGDLFYDSGYDIRKLVEAILLNPEFLSPRAYRALVKSPVELLVGSLRTLGVKQLESDPLFVMGQSLFAPPNVKGWAGGRHWINSATFLARVNYFGDLLRPDESQPDPLPVFTRYRNQPIISSFNEMAELLLDNQAAGLNQIQNFVEAPFVSETGDSQGQKAESEARLRGAVHLMMSTPDYHLN